MIELDNYKPVNSQEEKDIALIKEFVKRNNDAYHRTNLAAHVTSSAIVVNENMDKVLFAHHNIYNSFGWVGGHNDGEEDCLKVALKEAKEETGINNIKAFSKDIIGVDVIHVTNHYKRGEYVPDHLHLNVTYLLIASEAEMPKAREGENSDVKWFPIDTALDVITEERMLAVYKKLFEKVRNINVKKV